MLCYRWRTATVRWQATAGCSWGGARRWQSRLHMSPDPFARSRLVNFLKRTAPGEHGPGPDGAPIAVSSVPAGGHAEEDSSTARFHAECRFLMPSSWPVGQSSDLMLPTMPDSSETNLCVGTGVGGSAKEAELAAVMHAELLVERCGFCIFGLPSKQARHAKEAQIPTAVASTDNAAEETKAGAARRVVALPPSDAGAEQRLSDIAKLPIPPSVSTLPVPLVRGSATTLQQPSARESIEAASSSSVNRDLEKDVIRPPRYWNLTVDAQEAVRGARADALDARKQRGRRQEMATAAAEASTTIEVKFVEDQRTEPEPFAQPKQTEKLMATWGTGQRNGPPPHALLLGVTPYPYNPAEAVDPRSRSVDWRCAPRYLPHTRVHPLKEAEDESEAGRFWLVDVGNRYASDEHALLSPHVVCDDSLRRVQMYWKHVTSTIFEEMVSVQAYRRPQAFSRAGGAVPFVEATVAVPGNVGVVAMGVATSQSLAMTLCAMHFELLVDHLGLRIYPTNELKQRLHADACVCAGRWASATLEDETLPVGPQHDRTMPKPLREWIDSSRGRQDVGGRRRMQTTRVAPLSADEAYLSMHHQIVVYNRSSNIDANPDDADDTLLAALRQFCAERNEPREAFYMNMDYGGQWRCTFLLPLPLKEYGLRGGYAVAATPHRAKQMCARHAVETLSHLGIPLFHDPEQQRRFDESRSEAGLLVYPRDYSNANATEGTTQSAPLLVAPPPNTTRSPPALREFGPIRPITPQAEVDLAQWLDAERFDVEPIIDSSSTLSSSEKKAFSLPAGFEGKQTTVDLTEVRRYVQSFFGCVVRCPMPYPMNVYYGQQPVRGRLSAPCNTAWFPLPLPVASSDPVGDGCATTGELLPTVAIGRGTTRKSAERMAFAHAARIIAHRLEVDGGLVASRWGSASQLTMAGGGQTAAASSSSGPENRLPARAPALHAAAQREAKAAMVDLQGWWIATQKGRVQLAAEPWWPRPRSASWHPLGQRVATELGSLPQPMMDVVMASRCNEIVQRPLFPTS